MVTDDDMLMLARALQVAGLETWTPVEQQDAPFLMTVESTGRGNLVRLRPHYLTGGTSVELPAHGASLRIAEFAVARAQAYDRERLEVPRFATENEALLLWHLLVDTAQDLRRGRAA